MEEMMEMMETGLSILVFSLYDFRIFGMDVRVSWPRLELRDRSPCRYRYEPTRLPDVDNLSVGCVEEDYWYAVIC